MNTPFPTSSRVRWAVVFLLLCRTSAFSSSTHNNARMTTTTDALSFVTEVCGALKEVKRKGWTMRRIPFPESDSDHMHRCAMCALLVSRPADPRDSYDEDDVARYHPSRVDTTKLLKMALTHDLCEALAGDVTPFCGVSARDKHATEDAAMERIRGVVGDPLGEDLYEWWKEYEAQETVEAVYCKDIDKFEMVVQAYEYEKKHLGEKPASVDPLEDLSSLPEAELPTVEERPLRTFFQTTRSSMRTPLFRRLDQELRERRQEMIESRGWKVTQTEQQDYN